jgi:SAM-dependent methyltransferase
MPKEEQMSTTTTTQTAQPDLAAVKARQQKMWASGNYAAVAARIVPMAEHLAEAAGLRPGDRVLDVATGSGNAALAAARYGCEVTGVDYVPELLERGRARAAAEGLEITFAEGDAEDLAFPDASFDAVLSVLGVMFAPDQERAAAELVRVCRPGGTIGLVNWTPAGFIGQLLKTVSKHVPPPAGVRPPPQWGTEERLRELLGDAVSRLEVTKRSHVWRFRSPEDFAGFFKDQYGPTRKAFEALDEAGQRRLWDDLTALAREHDTERGLTVAMPAEYVEVIATRA